MNVRRRHVFLTHGSSRIGLGHVRRCLALAGSLSGRGEEVTFVVSPDEAVRRLVESSGFGVTEVPWEADYPSAVRSVREAGADTVVVDSYAATAPLFEALRATVDQVVAVDDSADRPLPVDVVINGGVGAPSLRYRLSENRLLLLGPEYALIAAEYAEAPVRRTSDRIERVLVVLGGSLHQKTLSVALAAADSVLEGVVVEVVVGPYAGSAGVVDGAMRGRGNRAVIHGPVSNLRPLILQADVALCGAGMTLYELAATATPSIMVLTASNQSLNVRGFEQAGAAIFGGASDSH
ncbi:MAG TPA: UDP-2,4-diacetamido-2,4,6-trideoxy-beta-L-altropyranose hydrolase, partial [Methylomirabilota bacterium]|nr:UDP-2,4-diacetamido-2,4,6-trideoxy-beta-L-altropyranose hydrolase [Methylomirabilota bacterium]